MRITNNMLVADMLWNSNKNLGKLSTYQNQLSSGLRVSRPSDDPVGITKILKYKTDIRAANQYKDNVTTSLGWLEVSESALDDVKEILQRIREITVQAANGTNTPEDTQKIQIEVEQLRDEIISLGNSTMAGRYLFSGLETNKKLFNEDGTYNVDMTSERLDEKNVVGFEVYVGEVMEVGTHPIDVFGIGEDTSFYNGVIDRGSVETTEATRSKYVASYDITNNFTVPAQSISIDIGGTAYDVNMADLAQTVADPLTKSQFLKSVKEASDGLGGELQDVANIYFNENDELVVESKSFGSATSITGTVSSGGFAEISNTVGIDELPATFSSSVPLTDAVMTAYTEVSSMMLTFNGEQKKIELDFSTINTVADYTTALQTEIDNAFPPAGTITVTPGVDGNPLELTIAGNNDGSINKLDVDYIVSNESKMITDLNNLVDALNVRDQDALNVALGKLDENLEIVLTAMGNIGGKSNRTEFIAARIDDNVITFTGLLSDVQDVDMAEAIMWFKNLENVYKASLSVGSQVIQPSLVDFIS